MTTPGFGDLFGEEFLGADPNLTFQSFNNRFGQGQGRQNFFRDSFSQIQDQYLGELGRIARQGRIPEQSFRGFLDDFNFDQFAFGFTPSSRGEGLAGFNPALRFF